MKTIGIILAILIIVAIAVFTGSWIFDILATGFHYVGKGFEFLAEVFNFFGWNNGII